jgi:alpha-ribazole phosphatase
MEIYLIRHPEVITGTSICYGHSNVGISEEALNASLEKIKNTIPDYTNLVYYSSDLNRCTAVTEKIPGIEVHYSDQLREMNFGEWEMVPWNKIPPVPLKTWMDDFVNECCPGGESYTQLYSRVISFWKELLKKGYNRIAIVTHSGVIRSILCYILEVSLSNSFKFKIDYSGISLVKINNDSGVIEFINK